MNVIESIRAEPQAVILYERENEAAVREVMRDLVAEIAAEMALSDPLLSNLVVIDNENQIEKWPGWLNVTTPAEITLGTLHPSQTVVSLSPAFLHRKDALPLRRPSRLYVITPNMQLAARVGISTIIELKRAA